MSIPLAEQHCRALGRETAPLSGPVVGELISLVHTAWRIRSGPLLARRVESRDYPALVSLAAQIGALAQIEDHHPDMELGYGRLEVSLSTHSVGGLSLNDFILAAKIDRLAEESSF